MNARRILNMTIGVGILGALVATVWKGARTGIGFASGSILSILSLYGWINLAGALGASEKPPKRASVAFLAARYVLIGVAVYVIVKILEVRPEAVLAGLLASTAAVLIEILVELFFLKP